jgi:Protein of unknown function (DUF2752)
MSPDEIVNPPLRAAFLWGTLAAGAVYLFIFQPGRSGFFPTCPFRAFTGFACPGCGATRGLHCLLHGDFVAALKFNPLVILSLPFLLYTLVRYTNAAVRGRPLQSYQFNAKYIWALFVVILSFWVFRNTPFYPFPL